MSQTQWIKIGTILFVSGFCSLVYQVAWLRLLRHVFGVSTAAQAVVVAIFMGGLGLGGYLFGRRLRQVRNPLALYAGLELGIAITAGVSPFLVTGVRELYLALGGASALGPTLATGLRLVLSAIVLGASTTLMGGTLPAIAQAVERRSDRGRRDLAWLYGINTLGAVTGALLATFVLLELLGIRQSLWVAGLLNLLLALAARALARAAGDEPGEPEAGDVEETAGDPAAEVSAGISPEARWVLPIAGLVGFIFFLMELVWYRMLGPVLGGSSYTFGLILCVALLGIGLGGLLYAMGRRERRPTYFALALTSALEALFLILPFALGDDLTWFAAALRSLAAIGFGGLVLSWTLVTAVVVLPAAIIAGYQFPLLVALLGSDAPSGAAEPGGQRRIGYAQRRIGYEVGLAYAWNTWGAILGSLAGGFGLLPLLSAPRVWRLSALILIVLALVAVWLDRRRMPAGQSHGGRWIAPVVVSVLSLILCLADGPSAFWRHTPIGAGRSVVDFEEPNKLRWHQHAVRQSMITEAEGVESSVALLAHEDLSLVVNGKSDGSARRDAPTQVMSGLVGAILHPDPKNALVIGLGTGATAGWLAAVDSIDRVDVVELEPAVIEYAHAFAPVNHDVLDSPKIRMFEGDGRELVLTSSETYDVIFSEPSNPYRAGVADLFSQDFYRAASRRIGDTGVFLQWLQGYEVDAQVVETVFATLGSVFPFVETWQTQSSDLLLVATNYEIVHDFDRVRARVETEPFRSALRWTWRVEGAAGFYSGFLANGALAAAFAADANAVISTDDRPMIEFGFARNVGRKQRFRTDELHRLAFRLGGGRPRQVTGEPLDWALVDDYRQLRVSQRTAVYDGSGMVSPPPDRLRRFEARQAYGNGQLRAALGAWRQQDQEPATHLDRLLVAEALAELGDEAAEAQIALLEPLATTEFEALSARRLWRQGDPEAAVERLEAAFLRCREDGWFFTPIIDRTLSMVEAVVLEHPPGAERLLDVLGEPFAGRQLEINRLRVRIAVADALERKELCVRAFEPFEPDVPWEERFLKARAVCYETAGHPLLDRSRRELGDFLAAAAPKLRVNLPGADS